MSYVLVRLNGGPRDGKYVKYGAPLPNTIVYTEWNESKGFAYVEYQRSGAKDYKWVGRQGHETTNGPTQPG